MGEPLMTSHVGNSKIVGRNEQLSGYERCQMDMTIRNLAVIKTRFDYTGTRSNNEATLSDTVFKWLILE